MGTKRVSGFSGSSKGQVTVFIIIGIILLFSFAVVFFIVKSGTTERLAAAEDPIIAQVPQEFQPLQSYTDSCIRQIGKRGLLVLGEQGGYIYPDLMGEYSATNPTDAQGIDLQPLKVPYWHYNAEPNNANKIIFSSLQPKLYASEDSAMSIEAQLARYVEDKLDDCLRNYEPFAGQGFMVTILSPKEVAVRVGEESVNFLLTMKVEAARGEAEHTIKEFYVKIPLRLKHYYEVAQQITQAEQNYSFMERQGMELIQVYSAVDASKLPPTSGETFELVPTIYWNTPDVKGKIKQMLASHVPVLRLASNSNFYRYEYPVSDLSGLYQQTYDTTVLPLFDNRGVNVNFDYFGWEPYFEVNDKGGTIQPLHLARHYQLLHFGIQTYDTLYDISYPVLITLEDSTALDGDGFTFVFALESNIRRNQPAQDEQTVPGSVSAFSSSNVCDKDKYGTEILKTIIIDSATQEPLEAVQIGLTIPQQDTCVIGVTDQQGELESKYPAVYGGALSLIKADYLTNFYPIDTYKYKEQPGIIGYATAYSSQPILEMHKYKTVQVSVKKKNIEKCVGNRCFFSNLLSLAGGEVYSYTPQSLDAKHAWIYTGVTKELSPEEEATIVLTRVGDLNEKVRGEAFGTAISLSGNNLVQEVQLVPGIYEVTGLLTRNKEVLIPQEERCTDPLFLGLLGDECFTIDELILGQFLEGQLQWDERSTYLTITPEQLYSSNNVEFYIPSINIQNVPAQEHIRVVEDIQMVGQLENISRNLRQQLEPKFT